jgi:hypothetical protein
METVLQAWRKVGLEINTHNTIYMVVSRQQNVGQSHSLLLDNKSIENVAKFKYLGIKCSKSKLHALTKILKQIKFGECFLPFCLVFCLPISSLKF